MLNYRLVETVSRKTLLGIRFWDPALNTQIRSGLAAVLYPVENHRKQVYATCTRSGIYAFHKIPGMIDLETMPGDDEEAQPSPVPTSQFVLEVSDPKQRFSSVASSIELPLPYNGLFLADDVGSPANQPQGFNLYSSIDRYAPTQFAFVRGDLITRVTGQPAAYALVRVDTEDGFSWYGISDEDGKFAVMMSYPSLDISFGSSPPASEGIRLFQRVWTVTVSVMYEPLAQAALPGSELPDYSSVLSQEQAFLYTESPETDEGEAMQMQDDLEYGRDLIVNTAGFSELYINPTGSPA